MQQPTTPAPGNGPVEQPRAPIVFPPPQPGLYVRKSFFYRPCLVLFAVLPNDVDTWRGRAAMVASITATEARFLDRTYAVALEVHDLDDDDTLVAITTMTGLPRSAIDKVLADEFSPWWWLDHAHPDALVTSLLGRSNVDVEVLPAEILRVSNNGCVYPTFEEPGDDCTLTVMSPLLRLDGEFVEKL